MRRPVIAGNWKLHKTVEESIALARGILRDLPSEVDAEVLVAPVFTALHAVHGALAEHRLLADQSAPGRPRVSIAGQNCYFEDEGAFTGEVSPAHLKDAGCEAVIVGHSERRHIFGESDDMVRRKVGALLKHELTPIVCVGEKLDEREAGDTERVVLGQLDAAMNGLDESGARRLMIAYEPVWAIGTGRTASPADAQAVHAAIRGRIAVHVGQPAADVIRILYGGSVKPSNASELLAQSDIDGALVGGASLDAKSFVAIVAAVS